MSSTRIPRPVHLRSATPGLPRRMVLTAAVAGLGLATSGRALWAQEGGEAGEGAALEGLSEKVAFLTELGLFESQILIVQALEAEGKPDLARQHLEETHHASYDEVAEGIAQTGTPDFRAEADSFVAAVASGAGAEAVTATAGALLARIADLRHMAGDKDRMQAAEALLRHSAEDLEAGVSAGTVELPQEYRDSWGFTMVALEWLEELAADKEPDVAEAAQSALATKADVLAQYAGIDTPNTPGDAGALLAAAARVELAAFRLN